MFMVDVAGDFFYPYKILQNKNLITPAIYKGNKIRYNDEQKICHYKESLLWYEPLIEVQE